MKKLLWLLLLFPVHIFAQTSHYVYTDSLLYILNSSGSDTLGTIRVLNDSLFSIEGMALRVGSNGTDIDSIKVVSDSLIAYSNGTRYPITISGGSGSGSGDIEGVTAGTNLNGGGTSGTVTLNVDDPLVTNAVNLDTLNNNENAATTNIVVTDSIEVTGDVNATTMETSGKIKPGTGLTAGAANISNTEIGFLDASTMITGRAQVTVGGGDLGLLLDTGDGGLKKFEILTNLQAFDSDLSTLSSPTAWRIFYSNGSSVITELALGTSGQVLKSNGATSAPSWQADATGGGGSATADSAATDHGNYDFDKWWPVTFLEFLTDSLDNQNNKATTNIVVSDTFKVDPLTASQIVALDANKLTVNWNEATFKSNYNLEIGTDVQAWDTDLDTWAGVTPAAGIATFLASPTSANLGSAVTNETGNSGGAVLVFNNSPVITTPFMSIVYGSSANGGDLTLRSTSGATKGTIFMADQGGDIQVGGAATVSPFRFLEPSGAGTNYVGLKAPATIASSIDFALPNADGNANEVLYTDGSLGLGWLDVWTEAENTAAGYISAETNDLEGDGAANIADTEIFIGTGAGTGNYAALSGDATMANNGAVTVVDDSHNHIITNIDAFTVAQLQTQTSDVTTFYTEDTVVLIADGGTGVAFVDPGVDALYGWEDGIGRSTFMLFGDGLELSADTTISVTWEDAAALEADGSLSAETVDSDQYVDGSIDNAHIADDQIDSEHYAAGSIDNEHMAANSVDSDNYVDGSVDRVYLGTDVVLSDTGSIFIHFNSADTTATNGSLAFNSLGKVDAWVFADDTRDSLLFKQVEVIPEQFVEWIGWQMFYQGGGTTADTIVVMSSASAHDEAGDATDLSYTWRDTLLATSTADGDAIEGTMLTSFNNGITAGDIVYFGLDRPALDGDAMTMAGGIMMYYRRKADIQ